MSLLSVLQPLTGTRKRINLINLINLTRLIRLIRLTLLLLEYFSIQMETLLLFHMAISSPLLSSSPSSPLLFLLSSPLLPPLAGLFFLVSSSPSSSSSGQWLICLCWLCGLLVTVATALAGSPEETSLFLLNQKDERILSSHLWRVGAISTGNALIFRLKDF